MHTNRTCKNLPSNYQLTSYAGGLSTPSKEACQAVPSVLAIPQLEVCTLHWRILCAFVAVHTPYSISAHFIMQHKKPLLHHFNQLNIRNPEGEL